MEKYIELYDEIYNKYLECNFNNTLLDVFNNKRHCYNIFDILLFTENTQRSIIFLLKVKLNFKFCVLKKNSHDLFYISPSLKLEYSKNKHFLFSQTNYSDEQSSSLFLSR